MDAACCWLPTIGARHYRGKGDFHLDQLGRISRRREAGGPFIYHPDRFPSPAARSTVVSTNVLWSRAIEEDASMAQFNSRWFEVGDPASIAPEAALTSD
ncbi:MAG: hypothetical protein R3D83_02030 [Caenibius sp.]